MGKEVCLPQEENISPPQNPKSLEWIAAVEKEFDIGEPDPGIPIPEKTSLWAYVGSTSLLKQEEILPLIACVQKGIEALELLDAKKDLPEEEKAVPIAHAKDGKAARFRLFACNLRLVKHVALGYRTRHMKFADRFQEGAIGLMQAIVTYDPTKKTKFSTWATLQIRFAISGAIRSREFFIKIPNTKQEIIPKFVKAQKDLEEELGRPPNISEIAQELQIPKDQAEELKKLILLQRVLFFSMPTKDGKTVGNHVSRMPVASPEDLLNVVTEEDIDALFRYTHVPFKSRRAVRLRFGLEKQGKIFTLEEIGRMPNIRQHQGTSNKIREAIRKIGELVKRNPELEEELRAFLR